MRGTRRIGALALIVLLLAGPAGADPCGMVPPIFSGTGPPITRVGAQNTYVFYKNGIETFVIRPGFSGKVDNFGMLIPFPTPPAIRKVPDEIFLHLANAVDPPEVKVWIRRYHYKRYRGMKKMAPKPTMAPSLRINEVRVLSQEAIGMYQVAVLEAGSAKALKRWMDRNGYKYPKGMDKATEDYVKLGWCFVAVKTRVAGKKGISPRPGMRKTKLLFPKGGSFDGKVQAMGFRFYSKTLVVPMRLSAFNAGRLRNVVYLLTEGPRAIRRIPKEFVRRQISGAELYRNVTQLLPLRVYGGKPTEISRDRWSWIQRRRNPEPFNGHAKDLFASDLLAVKTKSLTLAHEEENKVLLRIGERLGLRGKEIDALHDKALEKERHETVRKALNGLKAMTLTIVDGDFPRDVLASDNLTFAAYRMPPSRNSPSVYYMHGTMPTSGTLTRWQGPDWSRPPKKRETPTTVQPGRTIGMREIAQLFRQLEDGKTAEAALKRLISLGSRGASYLLGEAREGRNLLRRGWSIVGLSEIGGPLIKEGLPKIYDDSNQPMLVRTWAAAALIELARQLGALTPLRTLISRFPATRRPFLKRLMSLVTRREGLPLLLTLASQDYSLRSKLAPAITSFGVKPLVKEMVHGKGNIIRQLAAGYLGGLAQKKAKEVAKAVVHAYRFRRGAVVVPWDGGALFVPGISWNREEAQALVRELIQWMVFVDIRQHPGVHRQLHNNLRSLQLARVAGYQSPGWSMVDTTRWLAIWGRSVGCPALVKVLKTQGQYRNARYRAALDSVGCP